MSNITKGVSIIICCYNSSARLFETLNYAKRQKVNNINWEIIVVDNASTDSTASEARKILATAPSPDFSVIYEPEPGLINARRRAYGSAKYEYLLFCDDDNWLAEDYLSIACNVMESNPKIAILGAFGEAVFENGEPEWFKTHQPNFAVGDQSPSTDPLSRVNEVYGAGMIIRRSYLAELYSYGFKSLLLGRTGSQLMAGEETELCYVTKLLGYEVWFHRGLKFKHLMTRARMNLDYLKRLHYGFGRTRVYLYAYKYCMEHYCLPGAGLRYPFWLDRLLYYLKIYLNSMPKYYFRRKEMRLDDELSMIGLKGSMHELFRLREKYQAICQDILDFMSKVAQQKK